jgi:prepilin-type N-terminal cleavage/methylation domain-containing protein
MKRFTPKATCQNRFTDILNFTKRSDEETSRLSLYALAKPLANQDCKVGHKSHEYGMNKKAAFTLAEVLITLAIIGVVAALTIPSLINKCQKIVLAKQAQKEYAMWTQAFKSVLVDNNTTSLSETELWNNIESKTFSHGYNPTTSNTGFWTELNKYLKISTSSVQPSPNLYAYFNDEKSSKSTNEYYRVFLSDGSMLRFFWIYKTVLQKSDEACAKIKNVGGNMCDYVAYIFLDINGNAGPNIYGRDILAFYLSNEGILYPEGGKDYAIFKEQISLSSNTNYWKNIYTGTKQENAKKDGRYRTGQLVEENWKMNY